ncbi:hypothetical protein Tco_1134879 [Tanacetum coccineum]
MARLWDYNTFMRAAFSQTLKSLAMMTGNLLVTLQKCIFEVGSGSGVDRRTSSNQPVLVSLWRLSFSKTESGIRLMLAPRSARAKHSSNSGKSHAFLNIGANFRHLLGEQPAKLSSKHETGSSTGTIIGSVFWYFRRSIVICHRSLQLPPPAMDIEDHHMKHRFLCLRDVSWSVISVIVAIVADNYDMMGTTAGNTTLLNRFLREQRLTGMSACREEQQLLPSYPSWEPCSNSAIVRYQPSYLWEVQQDSEELVVVDVYELENECACTK